MDTGAIALAAYSSGSAPYRFLCRTVEYACRPEPGPVRDTPFLIESATTRCQPEMKPDGLGSLDD